jgi:RimJ/RimL family protein N-acetyltransferase
MIARCHPDNRPSRRVAEKLGLALERTTTARHGAVPVVVYGLDRAGWRARRR